MLKTAMQSLYMTRHRH